MNGQPMETAPKDGTVVRVMNRCMEAPVEAKWGRYTNSVGNQSDEWILVKDSTTFMPLRPGTLVIPDEWWLLGAAESAP